MRRLAPLSLLPLIWLGACGTVEPTTSYCEAVCDWGASCAEAERPTDGAALDAACLQATYAEDPGCARADEGTLNPAAHKTVQSCVSAIDQAASEGRCDSFSGSIDDLKTGTPPAACATTGPHAQPTFQAAQRAVAEPGEALCERFTQTFCVQLDSCVIADLGTLPEPVVEELGTPLEMCVEQLAPQTGSCQQRDLYAVEASFSEINAPRQAARECLRGFDAVTCDALLTGEVPELCAASFASPEEAAAFFGAMVGVVQQIQAAMEELESQQQ